MPASTVGPGETTAGRFRGEIARMGTATMAGRHEPTGRQIGHAATATEGSGTPAPDSGGRPTPSRERSVLRAVAMPAEHGGWGLTIEPVVLGLLVAPSVSGAMLGLAAVVAFLARTPVKMVLVDRWRQRTLPRTIAARRFAAGELAVLAALLVTVALDGGGSWWLPLAAASPLVATEMWFDMRSRGRRLLPELCGAVGIASVAAGIARAGGAGWPVAAGLSLVLIARCTGAIPSVRAQVMRARGRNPQIAGAVAAQGVGLGIALSAWLVAAAPLISVAAVGCCSLWALWSLRRPPLRSRTLGYTQMALGIAVVLLTAGGLRLV